MTLLFVATYSAQAKERVFSHSDVQNFCSAIKGDHTEYLAV